MKVYFSVSIDLLIALPDHLYFKDLPMQISAVCTYSVVRNPNSVSTQSLLWWFLENYEFWKNQPPVTPRFKLVFEKIKKALKEEQMRMSRGI